MQIQQQPVKESFCTWENHSRSLGRLSFFCYQLRSLSRLYQFLAELTRNVNSKLPIFCLIVVFPFVRLDCQHCDPRPFNLHVSDVYKAADRLLGTILAQLSESVAQSGHQGQINARAWKSAARLRGCHPWRQPLDTLYTGTCRHHTGKCCQVQGFIQSNRSQLRRGSYPYQLIHCLSSQLELGYIVRQSNTRKCLSLCFWKRWLRIEWRLTAFFN